jgi:hypothetical protein
MALWTSGSAPPFADREYFDCLGILKTGCRLPRSSAGSEVDSSGIFGADGNSVWAVRRLQPPTIGRPGGNVPQPRRIPENEQPAAYDEAIRPEPPRQQGCCAAKLLQLIRSETHIHDCADLPYCRIALLVARSKL